MCSIYYSLIYTDASQYILLLHASIRCFVILHACIRGGAICPSVVVVSTKMAQSGDVSPWVSCNGDQTNWLGLA